MPGHRTNSGSRLLRDWAIPARQAMYHQGGTFFMPLDKFPGAYCDPDGYVVFATESSYKSCPNISIGKRANVHGGISKLPGYIRASSSAA
ncbi:hypothetical protein [Pseudoxanthomonas sp. LARHCG66]|jgi:hypothetical protein